MAPSVADRLAGRPSGPDAGGARRFQPCRKASRAGIPHVWRAMSRKDFHRGRRRRSCPVNVAGRNTRKRGRRLVSCWRGSSGLYQSSITTALSSDAKCNTPRRSGVGLAVHDQWECRHAILLAPFRGGKRPDRRLRAAGRSIDAIAKALGRPKCTISRELFRNSLASRRAASTARGPGLAGRLAPRPLGGGQGRLLHACSHDAPLDSLTVAAEGLAETDDAAREDKRAALSVDAGQ